MNELIERVQCQLDNNHPVEKEDIQELIYNYKLIDLSYECLLEKLTDNNLIVSWDKLKDIKPPINKPES